jgi:hypothetical protein
VPNTYRVFGNNGSLPYASSVKAAGNTALSDIPRSAAIPASTLYTDLASASDHLPVVADYTIPVGVPGLGLGNATYSAPGTFQFSVTNSDATAISAGEASRISLYSASSLDGTSSLLPQNSASLTNGVINVADSSALSSSAKFYWAEIKP